VDFPRSTAVKERVPALSIDPVHWKSVKNRLLLVLRARLSTVAQGVVTPSGTDAGTGGEYRKMLRFLYLSVASGLVIRVDCWYTVFVVVEEVTPADVVTVSDIVNAAGAATPRIVRMGF